MKNLKSQVSSCNNTLPGKSKVGYGDYLRFRDLVLERSGLHFPEKKRDDLETGLFKALAESSLAPSNGTYNLNHYYNLLSDRNDQTGQTEMKRLIKYLTIGETYFFRNEAQFDALINHVLPKLIARKRAAAAALSPDIQPQLRFWSAGCATGQEPYSLAILLKELLSDIDNWQILILATDINQDSLARAQEARYSEWSFRENRSKALQARYFTYDPTTKRYQLSNDIRQMVTFAPLNLIEDNYPAIGNNTVSLDLILCRNVTIYFTEEITRWVVKRFYQALTDKGWLVVGHSEPSLVGYRAFEAVNFPNTLLYQKTGKTQPWPNNWNRLDQTDKSDAVDSLQLQQTARERFTSFWSPSIVQTKPAPNFDLEPSTITTLSPTTNEKHATTKNIDFTLSSNNKAVAMANLLNLAPVPAEEDFYEVAGILLTEGQIEESIAQLHCQLAITPDFALAHSLLGRAYANLGCWAEARYWCQSALDLDTLSAEAYLVLALVYQQEDQIELAIAMYKKAIYLNRDAPLAHFNLAMLYKKTGQPLQAERACRNVVRILEKWPGEKIIPESGGTTAKHLLEVAWQILNDLETGQK